MEGYRMENCTLVGQDSDVGGVVVQGRGETDVFLWSLENDEICDLGFPKLPPTVLSAVIPARILRITPYIE